MEFKNEDNHLAFILLTLIIFFGVYTYLLIPNYMSVPKINNSFIFGVTNYHHPSIKVSYPDFYVIGFSDNKITNIENIIINICMLWGFLRFIDLMRFLENYKKEESIKNV